MKKIIIVLIIICVLMLLFTSCWRIQNITDPIPDEYTKGIDPPKDYPEKLEIHDDGVVFESDDSRGEIAIKYGVNHSLENITEFYEVLFKDKDFVIEKSDEDEDGYIAEGTVDGYTFQIEAVRPSGSYQIRSYVWVIEIKLQESTQIVSEVDEAPTAQPTEDAPEDMVTPEPVIIYPDSLEIIKGFWQVCGFVCTTDIYFRSYGVAIHINEDMTITGYDNFEIVFENIPFSFASEDIITFVYDDQVQEVQFYFTDIHNESYLTMYGLNHIMGEAVFSAHPEMHLVKSDYYTLMSYQGDIDEYERKITLDESFTDEELEFLIIECDWISSEYYYPDESFERAEHYELYRFNTGHIGIYEDWNGNTYKFSWALVDNIVYLYFHNGAEEAYLLDYTNDGDFIIPKLFFFEMDEGRLGRARVFIRFAC